MLFCFIMAHGKLLSMWRSEHQVKNNNHESGGNSSSCFKGNSVRKQCCARQENPVFILPEGHFFKNTLYEELREHIYTGTAMFDEKVTLEKFKFSV